MAETMETIGKVENAGGQHFPLLWATSPFSSGRHLDNLLILYQTIPGFHDRGKGGL